MKKYPTLMPCLTVQNARKAIAFYEKAFGFTWDNKEEAPTSEEDVLHVEMCYKDVRLMFSPEGAYDMTTQAPASLQIQSPMTLYLYCDDVDAFYQKAIASGAVSLMEPHDAFWGDRVRLKTLMATTGCLQKRSQVHLQNVNGRLDSNSHNVQQIWFFRLLLSILG